VTQSRAAVFRKPENRLQILPFMDLDLTLMIIHLLQTVTLKVFLIKLRYIFILFLNMYLIGLNDFINTFQY
jgi:hypothetical protein